VGGAETSTQFINILDSNKTLPMHWESIRNIIIWRYLWEYEGKRYSYVEWLYQNAKIAALDNELLQFVSTSEGISLLLQRQGNLVEKVINRVNALDDGPYVLVTSHSIVPGAIAALMALLPDMYYIKSAVVPNANPFFDDRAINLGPNYMVSHNLTELSRMDKLLRAGKKLLIFMDMQAIGPEKNPIEHSLAGQTVRYDDFFAPYVWNKKLRSLWIDARFIEGQLDYELEDMPNPNDFEEQTSWTTSWLDNYHSHIKEGFYGNKGVGNNSFHIAESLIPKAFEREFSQISQLLRAN
jgi:hypothetical protein